MNLIPVIIHLILSLLFRKMWKINLLSWIKPRKQILPLPTLPLLLLRHQTFMLSWQRLSENRRKPSRLRLDIWCTLCNQWMTKTPCNWHNISHPSPNALPLLMDIQPIFDTYLPLSVTQAYFITHTWPQISDYWTSSTHPPTLFSIWNISLLTSFSSWPHICNSFAEYPD